MATSAAPEAAAAAAQPLASGRSLAAELAQFEERVADSSVRLGELIAALANRAYELLLMLLVLPFLVPVSVPGMSTPLGLLVAAIALPLALGRLPWLPRWLRDTRLPPGFLRKVLVATRGSVRLLERVLRPSWPAVTAGRWLTGAHRAMIFALGLVLALPLPLPLTNTFPGWGIFLLAAGLMERDGRAVLAGYAMVLATAAWFFVVGAAIHHSLAATWHWLAGS
ncbi:MAG TPA: exopolysaccharide biosynthesis protein [Opitutaceae bacterium]|nr:exopolysaccharide biosynthesis protein [Opitutaceae bacterium]